MPPSITSLTHSLALNSVVVRNDLIRFAAVTLNSPPKSRLFSTGPLLLARRDRKRQPSNDHVERPSWSTRSWDMSSSSPTMNKASKVSATATATTLAFFPFNNLSLPTGETFLPLSQFLLDHPFPTYASSIILTTIFLRTLVTLPITVWSRKRMRRMRELVQPEMKLWNEKLAVKLVGESRKAGLDFEGYKKELKRQVGGISSIQL